MDRTDSSDSEEFFDAQDNLSRRMSISKSPPTSAKIPQEIKPSSSKTNEFQFSKSEPEIKVHIPNDEESTTPSTISPSLSTRYDHAFAEPKALGLGGRQRFRELRKSMQNDEDENVGNTLTPDSQNSSVEGVYTPRPSHPFRIIENDSLSVQSMTSLGRVGRLLAGNADTSSVDRDSIHTSISSSGSHGISQITPTSSTVNSQSTTPENSSISKNSAGKSLPVAGSSGAIVSESKFVLQEPDVIASTKLAHSKTTDSIISSGPIAPPRRKKKTRKISTSSSEQFNMNEGMKLPPSDDAISVKSFTDSASIQSLTKDINKWKEKEDTGSAKNHSQKRRNELAHGLERSCNEVEFQSQTQPCSSGIKRPAQTSTTGSSSTAISTCVANISSNAVSRISHSLGNSSTSVCAKPSPSNSAKSNSAPGRVSYHSIDPTISARGGLNLYKVSQGVYVVKPSDDATNKAQGPPRVEIGKIFDEDSIPRYKLAGTGSNSLGNDTRYSSRMGYQQSMSSLSATSTSAKERRKSAGDEDCLKQMNIYVRTRTDSGKRLTDMEILEQVPVKNLDTGENMTLSSVRPPPTPDGWNPLSLHIHKLYGHLPVNNNKESDEESVLGIPPNLEIQGAEEEEGEAEDGNGTRLKRRAAKIKRIFGTTVRKTVDKAKSLASEVSHARHKEDVADIVDVMNPEQNIKIKASNSNKGPYEFAKLQHVQDLCGEHTGAVWCMKFSSCGRLLATAGQDKILRIWVLRDAYPFFQDMRTKYNADQKSSPTPSQESLVSQHSNNTIEQQQHEASMDAAAADISSGPFMPKAFCSYNGHTSDLLDVSWSKNYFILSSSMDKTVRLWHISRKECLCCFQHIDFVTAIAFHPRDDRYFLSGSLDGKLRLWNIPDKKVALWNEVDGQTKLITAANFCQNGQFAVVGSYDGRCIFYNTDQLKYHTQINVRSTRGKNRVGRKISGIEPMPGEDKILVTSNDSRVRLYDLRDLNLSCKYKGYLNISSQIKASFSHDGKYIVAGSENQCIYIWKTNHDCAKLSSVRRDRSDFWEGIKAHNAAVTCAIFAPHPEAIIKPEPDDEIAKESGSHSRNIKPDPLVEQRKKGCGYVLVSADFNGSIKVFLNKTKPKHSSLPYTAIE